MCNRELMLVVLASIAMAGACDERRTPPVGESSTTMAGKKTTGAPLAGTWRKASADSCANQYPEEIRFLEGGVYLTGIPDGEFRYWQSGDYEVENEHRLRIQTANDAMQSYEFEIDAGGLLTITDERRCEVRYERQHQGHDDSGYP